MQTQRPAWLNRIEIALIILIVVTVVASLIPVESGGLHLGQLTQTLNNARQLYIAGYSMAIDHDTKGDDALGWPGDLAERKTDPLVSISQYINRLVAYDYLRKSDMQKVMQAPDVTSWDITKPFAAEYCPFKVYRVKETDGPSVIFCATRNFTYNEALSAKAPYGHSGFVLFRIGGDGSVFNNKKMAQPTNLSTLGLLPGRTDYATRNVETPDDYLAQR